MACCKLKYHFGNGQNFGDIQNLILLNWPPLEKCKENDTVRLQNFNSIIFRLFNFFLTPCHTFVGQFEQALRLRRPAAVMHETYYIFLSSHKPHFQIIASCI
jgi:hypothetical protein